jgi:hypothetical protein
MKSAAGGTQGLARRQGLPQLPRGVGHHRPDRGRAPRIVQKVTGRKTTEIVLKHYSQPGREVFREAYAPSQIVATHSIRPKPFFQHPPVAAALYDSAACLSEKRTVSDALCQEFWSHPHFSFRSRRDLLGRALSFCPMSERFECDTGAPNCATISGNRTGEEPSSSSTTHLNRPPSTSLRNLMSPLKYVC